MKRGIPVVVAAIMIVAAFAAGYALQSPGPIANVLSGRGEALAQSPSPPPPSPRGSPPGGPSGGRDRGILTGTVESVQGRTLVVKVTSARGVKADQGTMYTLQVEADASILREVALADLKKGNTVTVRGSVTDGKLVVRQVVVELR